jgi:hypothetical protein
VQLLTSFACIPDTVTVRAAVAYGLQGGENLSSPSLFTLDDHHGDAAQYQ